MPQGWVDVTPKKDIMKNPILTFGPNELGRDFVIGDLHGGYPALQNLKRNLDFDEEKDRMFSASDLVDRGPNSYECFKLLREKWFHPCLANHEQLVAEAFKGTRVGQWWMPNGGGWGAPALQAYRAKQRGEENVVMTDEEADIIDLVKLIDELPFLITINHKNGKKFHVLHAELPPKHSGSVTDKDLEDPETVLELATTQTYDGDAFLWGRYLFMPFYGKVLTKEKVVTNLKRSGVGNKTHGHDLWNDERSMIISGHTIMTHPITIVGQTNIDTCAHASCREDNEGWEALTCIELDTWTFYQATPTTFKTVEPLVINREDLE